MKGNNLVRSQNGMKLSLFGTIGDMIQNIFLFKIEVRSHSQNAQFLANAACTQRSIKIQDQRLVVGSLEKMTSISILNQIYN